MPLKQSWSKWVNASDKSLRTDFTTKNNTNHILNHLQIYGMYSINASKHQSFTFPTHGAKASQRPLHTGNNWYIEINCGLWFCYNLDQPFWCWNQNIWAKVLFQFEEHLSKNKNSYNKTIRLSNLYIENPYTSDMISLYWNGPNINTMTAAGLVPCVARTPAIRVLTMHANRDLIYNQERFQLPVISQCSVTIENENTFLYFLKKIQTYLWQRQSAAHAVGRPGPASWLS